MMDEYKEIVPPTVDLGNMPDTYPMYPNGFTGFIEYLRNNAMYPSNAWSRRVEGKITIKYAVDTDGSTVAVEIIQGIDQELDAEIVRVLSSIKNWVPAKMDGQPIQFFFQQSIYYKL